MKRGKEGRMQGKMMAELQHRGRMPLALDGWQKLSVWGWDDMQGALFAQLWRNTDDRDGEPRVWITPGYWPATTSPGVLAGYIAQATGCSGYEATEAMARCAPRSVKEALLGTAV